MGEKDDYDSENSWISDGLPSSSRRRRREGGRWEMEERSEVPAILLQVITRNNFLVALIEG